jgi:hypothetical protein
MVSMRFNHNWPCRGLALLWDPKTLAELIKPAEVVSLRQFFAIADDWPEDLPAANGDAIVVSGFEGCIDVLGASDVERWIETDLREVVLSFQDYYEGQAGLILWLPSGRKHISMKGASEQYYWKHRGAGDDGIPIGQLLFSGAENEVERIMNTDDPNADCDGKYWAGLHHPRIS